MDAWRNATLRLVLSSGSHYQQRDKGQKDMPIKDLWTSLKPLSRQAKVTAKAAFLFKPT